MWVALRQLRSCQNARQPMKTEARDTPEKSSPAIPPGGVITFCALWLFVARLSGFELPGENFEQWLARFAEFLCGAHSGDKHRLRQIFWKTHRERAGRALDFQQSAPRFQRVGFIVDQGENFGGL